MMNNGFRKAFFLGAIAVFGWTPAACGQFAGYGMVSAEKVSGFACASGCASTDGTERPYGGTFGMYYDFRSYGPIRLGADLRGTFLNGNKSAASFTASQDLVRHYAGLAGARATFHTPIKWLQPYVQASGGFGKFNGANAPQIEGLAGLDLALGTNFDFRLIEAGAGEIFGTNSHTVQAIGLGVVFHGSREK